MTVVPLGCWNTGCSRWMPKELRSDPATILNFGWLNSAKDRISTKNAINRVAISAKVAIHAGAPGGGHFGQSGSSGSSTTSGTGRTFLTIGTFLCGHHFRLQLRRQDGDHLILDIAAGFAACDIAQTLEDHLAIDHLGGGIAFELGQDRAKEDVCDERPIKSGQKRHGHG